MRYNAKLDATAKAITIGTFVLCGSMIFWLTGRYFREHFPADFFTMASVVLVLAVAYLYRPLYFTLDEKELAVHRPGRTMHVPLNDITGIQRVQESEAGRGIRLFGSGGFFGYLGIFYYSRLGRVRMYCTDRSELLLVTTTKRHFIISPEGADDFLREWKRIAKRDQG